ncbi:MAG: hypothetical protein FD130_2548 [Halothiobacillaceae bacterium]|nr:MAG: hypothetical protein FD130_2548 [Halothiobacillaceae bacterium]
MKWTTTLTTLLLLFGFGGSPLVLAETGEALPVATGKPLVTFDLDEYFRGETELPRAIHLEVDEQGNYLATYHLISDDSNLNKHHEDRGQLDGETLQYIRDWLGIIKFESLPSDGKALNIG